MTSKVIVSLAGLGTVILVSRSLGAEGRGVISLFLSSVAMVQLFCDFGNSTAIINLCYTHNVRNLYLSSLLWTLFICLIAFPVLYLIGAQSFIIFIAPAAFLYTFINLNQHVLMGHRQVSKRNMSLVLTPVLLLLFYSIFYSSVSISTSHYLIALFCALILSALWAYNLGRKYIFKSEYFKFDKDILTNGIWVQGAQAIQFLNYRLYFFFIAWKLGNAELGVFNNAVILCESIWILGHSIGQIQHMTILNEVDKRKNWNQTAKLIGISFGGSLLLFIILNLIPIGFWTTLFSDEFSSMKSLFIYLAPGVLMFSVSNIIAHYLHAMHRFRAILYCNLGGLIAGVAASIPLILSKGLQGAAIAWSTGLGISMLFYVFVYFRISANEFK